MPLRSRLKTPLCAAFMALDRLGVHLAPKVFYSPLPDYRWLRRNKESWMNRADLTGVEWNLDNQLRWLEDTCRPHLAEVAGLSVYEHAKSWGLGFGPLESQVLHCFIRSNRPKRIVEVGGGVSTACMLRPIGLNRNGKPASHLTCIEPYPSERLRKAEDVTLIEKMLQGVPATIVDDLRTGDLLSIDSTHAVKVGSDTLRIYLEIIPRLAPGVFIHIHDIYLPYLYPRDALSSFFGWQETSLLLALLTNNPRLRVRCCMSALHYDRTEELKRILPDYQPQLNDRGLAASRNPGEHFPSSIWLEVTP